MLITPVERQEVDEKYHSMIFDAEVGHEPGVPAGDRKYIRLLGNSPAALLHLSRLGLYLRYRSPLDARLRQIAILATISEMRDEFSLPHHTRMSHQMFGCSEDDVLYAIGGGDERPGSTEEAVRSLARQVVQQHQVEPSLARSLAETLGKRPFLDLLHSINYYINAGILNKVLEIGSHDDEPELNRYAERFPLQSL